MKIYEGFNLATWPRMSNSWIQTQQIFIIEIN